MTFTAGGTERGVPEFGSLAAARAAIDELDAELAALLERRAGLTRQVQRLKPVGGFAGRSPERERQIVRAMAERAPTLGAERLARIMDQVIEAGLAAAELDRHDRRDRGEERAGARVTSPRR